MRAPAPEVDEFELELLAGDDDFVFVFYSEAGAVVPVVGADVPAVSLSALVPVECWLENGV